MIVKNFFKELVGITSRLASVIIITIVAVMVFVGLNGINYNGNLIVKDYFKEQNIADYWVTGSGFSNDDYNKVLSLEGIDEIENRVVFEATDIEKDGVKLSLIEVSDNNNINKPYIVEGNLAKNSDEIMISSEFAKEQGLNIGDKYSVKILGSKKEYTFTIIALIKNPEKMYNVSATIPSPDYSKFGFGYVGQGALSDMLGKDTYNQIILTLDKDADKEAVKTKIIEVLEDKIINITSLEDNINANNLLDFIDGIKPIILGLPLIFFVIAALLMVSTMTRLIENSRSSIGTLKALGYSDYKILLYYFMYSFIVVVVGFLIGAFLSKIVITEPISKIVFGLNDLPEYTIKYDFTSLMKALVLTGVSCVGTSLLITGNALREKPAQCMRPKAPKKESRLILEKITFIWDRLGFSKKYIIKNTFRNKGRVFTCIVGIAACMALILTCLSLKDSINNFTSRVSDSQHKYDMYVTLNNKIRDYDTDEIDNLEVVEDTQYAMNSNAIFTIDDKFDTVNITVSEDNAPLKLIDTYDDRVSLPLDGVIIEDEFAEKYDLKVNDYIYLSFIGSEEKVKAKVVEINKEVVGMYISETYFEELGGEFRPNSVYIKAEDTDQLVSSLEDIKFVNDYELKETITDAIVNKISVLSLVVYILIVLGGVLAIVVLYNLGIMSFYEQIRSLATLMVLGFYPKEIKRLQLTENIILAILGIIAGIPLGIGLTKVITGALTLANLQPVAKASSYIFAALLTFIFANIVNLIIAKMMKKIDMIGALKSVE